MTMTSKHEFLLRFLNNCSGNDYFSNKVIDSLTPRLRATLILMNRIVCQCLRVDVHGLHGNLKGKLLFTFFLLFPLSPSRFVTFIKSCHVHWFVFQVLKLTEYSLRQIFPALDHFRVKFHQFFVNDYIHCQTNQLCYWIKFISKLFVFLLNLPCMKLMAVPKFSRDLGRGLNLNKSINWHNHMNGHVEIGHLTQYDAFRVYGDQVIDLEIWSKIHTNISNLETASPKIILTLRIFMIFMILFKMDKQSNLHLNFFQMVGAWQDFTVVPKLTKLITD